MLACSYEISKLNQCLYWKQAKHLLDNLNFL